MGKSTRYDTLVIEGATGTTVPREVDGGRVVSWAKGHALAGADPLEAFVQALANGDYIDLPGDALQLMAEGVMARHNRQLEVGYER
ncbi:hypothetical protein ACM7YY_32910 [Pseudomonas aeruginosa]